MKILAIESSCDETAAAIIGSQNNQPIIESSIVASQVDIHKEFGGVVPEVAARAHIENILPVIDSALSKARLEPGNIDRIAVTSGPGLIGSLVVGVETAKALSIAWRKPLFPINHLEGHIYANFIQTKTIKNQKPNLNENSKLKIDNSIPEFPLVALLVSGGHTLLIYMKNHLNYEIVGKTRDDAAGEAFDKGAKILGLPYPGGPVIAKLAEKGNENGYNFPVIDLTEKPKRNKSGFMDVPEPSLDFSFSGLKTALLTTVKLNPPKNERETMDLSASYQKAIVETLIQNSIRAINQYPPKTFILSGGVSANKKLRAELGKAVFEKYPNIKYLKPETKLSTDNAAMIGATAFFRGIEHSSSNFVAEPGLKLKSLS